MLVCITGASGYIGAHAVEQTLQRGYTARVLSRKPIQNPAWGTKGVQTFLGDVRDEKTLVPFLTGADALLNIAGVNTPSSNQRDNIFSSNVEGVRLILRTAHRCGVRKIVHTGSTAALGCRGRGLVNDEMTAFNLWNASTDYERSKHLGEEAALELHRKEGVPVLVAEPSACVGPGDAKPTYTGKLILDFINRKLPGYFDIRHNYVDVRDVALGHILALEKGAVGQRYLLCGDENILLSEFFAMITELTGAPAPRLKLPLWFVFPLAYANLTLWKITGKDPLIRLSTAKRAWLNMYYSNAKAKRELGYTPRTVKVALRDEIAWFLEQGVLDPSKVTLKEAG